MYEIYDNLHTLNKKMWKLKRMIEALQKWQKII